MRTLCAAIRSSAAVLLLLCSAPGANGAGTLDFYFIDVEQGASMLLVSPSGQSMLMDAGSAGNNGRDAGRVLAAMSAAGVARIDHLVVTHYHNDHYGATPELSAKTRIVNWFDHGPSVESGKSREWQKHWEIGADEELHKRYLEARARSRYKALAAGDVVPLPGVHVQVVTSAGRLIEQPLPGAGQPNPACEITPLRTEDETEDGQSIGVVITHGAFRFAWLGDLTWNKSRRLFCPVNRLGRVDAYVTTHHGMSIDKETAGAVRWGRSCCSEAEVHSLRPRVAILNSGERYHRLGGPRGWQVVRNSPGLEDFWQLHYQTGGGPENNVPEQFIANLSAKDCQGHWIKLSAASDGSFTATNARNKHSRTYAARLPK